MEMADRKRCAVLPSRDCVFAINRAFYWFSTLHIIALRMRCVSPLKMGETARQIIANLRTHTLGAKGVNGLCAPIKMAIYDRAQERNNVNQQLLLVLLGIWQLWTIWHNILNSSGELRGFRICCTIIDEERDDKMPAVFGECVFL